MKHKVAAIDIGSNAIRMVTAIVSEAGIKLDHKFRFPIRLGADVFDKGQISGKNLKISARTFKKFAEYCRKNQVQKLRAVGTSALRESKNGAAYVEFIFRKSGIKIEIIDGVQEAQLLHLAVRKEVDLALYKALLIDIGGGSVELTFSDKAQLTATQSFPFGTVRTLELLKQKKLTESSLPLLIADYLKPLSLFLNSADSSPGTIDFAVGTGGNIEALGKLKPFFTASSSKGWLLLDELELIIKELSRRTVLQRVSQLGLRPDRADVILPAALTVQTIMQQANIRKLIIPHVGLKEGLVWSLL